MRHDYNKDNIDKDFVDEDGWLTDTIAEGGKKRLTFNIARHGYRREPRGGNPPRSKEVYEEILKNPENVSVVISDAPQTDRRYSNYEPYACILASVCDAAGLIEKGRIIVCLTLADYKFSASLDGTAPYYGWSRNKQDLYGSTAKKHYETARELISLGAELVVAPESWDGPTPKCHLTGWTDENYARDYAFISQWLRSNTHAYSRLVPIIDADTPMLRKMAGSFAGDEAEQQRKIALSCSKEIFKGLELEASAAVNLLSYGLIKWEETKSKSYKVPIWKKELIRPTVEHFTEFNGGQAKDDIAGRLTACKQIWNASLNAYGVSFKPGTEKPENIVRAWKEIGSAMGVDSSIEAVLTCGVPVDDVIASI